MYVCIYPSICVYMYLCVCNYVSIYVCLCISDSYFLDTFPQIEISFFEIISCSSMPTTPLHIPKMHYVFHIIDLLLYNPSP